MTRRVVILLALALAAPSWAQDVAPVDAARALFLRGKYDEARAAFDKVLAGDAANDRAAALLTDLHVELGRPAEAEKVCDDFLRANPKSVPVRAAYAETLFARGKLDLALAEARKVEALDPKHLGARFLEGLILWDRGERRISKRVFETFLDEWRDRDEESFTPEEVVVLGRAVTYWALADRNAPTLKTIVNTVYPLALRKDPLYTPAMIASGMLFLEKYNVAQAAKEFEAALAVNPNHPLALVGLAQCELSERNFVKAHAYRERAAAVAPTLVDVLLLDGFLSVYDEDYAVALASAEKALAANPAHMEALGLKGACLYQLTKKDDYAAAEKVALAANPKCSLFYQTVGEVLVTRHRDGEAEPLFRKAVALAPGDSSPAASLGLCLMRLGREDEAYGILDAAYQADTFSAVLVNTLTLLDKMKAFETIKTPHFVIKLDPKADRALAAYLGDYLERTYTEVCARYKFEPPTTLIEVFPDHRMFSVRTTGTPNIGTVGACMGPTIAIDSPLVGPPGALNWEDVLRHEFTHAVTLAATDMRIAHWFTETLAVGEEKRPLRYEWYALLVDALDRDELMPVTELNYGFTRARTQARRQLAYAEAYLIGDFIVKTRGREKLAEMLARFKAGDTTAQVIEAVFKMKPEAFDAAFRDYARALAAASRLRPSPNIGDEDEIETRLAASPRDLELTIELARIKLARRDLTGAALAALDAVAISPTNARAHAALGAVRLAQKDQNAARAEFAQAVALDANERSALRGMLALSRLEKKDDESLGWLARLSALDPLNPMFYRLRATILLAKKDDAGAAVALAKIAELESQDYGARRDLARIMMARADYASAAKYLDEAIGIYPFEKQIHEWAAEAFEKLGQKDRAQREKSLIDVSKAPARPAPAPDDGVDTGAK